MEAVLKTAKGTIAVKESTDPLYPGIYVSVNGQDLVLVELDGDKFAVRVWDHKNESEDYVYKQEIETKPWTGDTSLETLMEDVRHVAEDEDFEVSDEVIYEVATRVRDQFSYSDYNEFIGEKLEEVVKDLQH